MPAATVTAHRRLLKISKAVAVPLYFYRHGDVQNPKYHILIEPAVDNLPSEDEVDDATRVNKIVRTNFVSHQLNICGFTVALKHVRGI